MAWYDEVIEEVMDAFTRRDFRAIERFAQPDVVFDFSRSMNDTRGVYHGIDQMEPTFRRFFEPWEEARWEVTKVEELDASRLLATTRITVRGRGSGIEVDASGAQVWEHRDRKLSRVTMYQSRDDALAEEPAATETVADEAATRDATA
jgi:ketosteroid isomerase-like protein